MRLRSDTPPASELLATYNRSTQLRVALRFGQWVANNYLANGEATSWPELYYEVSPGKAFALLVMEQAV